MGIDTLKRKPVVASKSSSDTLGDADQSSTDTRQRQTPCKKLKSFKEEFESVKSMYSNARATAVQSLRNSERENSLLSSLFATNTLGMRMLSLSMLFVRAKFTDYDNRFNELNKKIEIFLEERSRRDVEFKEMKQQLSDLLKRLDTINCAN